MIIRILHEGQYRLSDVAAARLDEIDDRLTQAVERGDRASFEADLAELIRFVHRHGKRLDDAHLEGSDLVLPPADASFEDVRAMLRDDAWSRVES